MTGSRQMRALVLAVLLAQVGAGCVADGNRLLAVGRPESAPTGLEVVLGQCSRPRSALDMSSPTDIEVRVESVPSTSTVDHDFDEVVWSVHTDAPHTVSSVVIGDTPEGFTSVTPLTVTLPEHFSIVVHSRGATGPTWRAELEASQQDVPADSGTVYDGIRSTSREEFTQRVRDDACGEDTKPASSTFGFDVTRVLLIAAAASGTVLALLAVAVGWRSRSGQATS